MTIDHLPFSSWNNIAIKAFIIPLIAELKHPPTRRSPSLKFFLHELDTMFDQAYHDLEDQATNVFLMQPKVDRMILFAAVGEWWSWRIATRDYYISQSPDSYSTDEADEASSTSGSGHSDSSYGPPPLFQPAEPPRMQPSRPAKNNRKYTTSPIPSLRPSDTRSYNPRRKGEEKPKKSEHPIRYTDLGADMEQVRNDVDLAKPCDNLWSKIILLGSPASNQRLFLIHRFLSTECKTMLDATLLVSSALHVEWPTLIHCRGTWMSMTRRRKRKMMRPMNND